MECEATYRTPTVCPPLIGVQRLEVLHETTPRQREKLSQLRVELEDV